MSRISAATISLFSLLSSFAYAVEEAEPPVQDNMMAVLGFFLICLACAVWFGWYMWKNQQKPNSEKEGEKF